VRWRLISALPADQDQPHDQQEQKMRQLKQQKGERYVETQQKDAQTHETTAGDTRQKAEAVIGSPCASSE